MPRVDVYTSLARVYDGLSGHRGLKAFGPAYESLIAGSGLEPGEALDLACGTGLWARRLAELGWSVTGLDRSEAMLARAKRRCRGLPVTFLQGDMLELPELGPFSLVTCMCDSLNYLSGAGALGTALSGIRRSLSPGGVAIFDTNTTAALRRSWGSGTIVRRSSGATCVLTTKWDSSERRNTLTFECFLPRKGEPGLFELHEEVHVERALDVPLVVKVAGETGLTDISALDIETLEPATDRTGKAIFVAGA